MQTAGKCYFVDYQDINSEVIDSWREDGWEWGRPISHETYAKAVQGDWGVFLTPTKNVPHDWFGDLRGKKLLGLASGMNFIFDDDETTIKYKLPYNLLKDEKLYGESLKNNWGMQFSHTAEEQIGGQLQAGFVLTHLYEATNGSGRSHEHNIPCFYAIREVKP